jgi:hypothetical protein
MKNNNQTLLKTKEELALMSTKFTADQAFEGLIRHWQSQGEERKGRIDQLVSENE